MEINQTPLDNIRNYLTKLLARTDFQKISINKECQLVQDLLIHRCVKEASNNKSDEPCDFSFTRGNENDKRSELTEKGNKKKTLVQQHKYPLNGVSSSKSKTSVSNPSFDLSKCSETENKTCSTSNTVVPIKKINCDEKNKPKPSSVKYKAPFNYAAKVPRSKFGFKDNDLIPKRVSPKPTVSVNNVKKPNTNFNHKVVRPKFITLPVAVSANEFQCSEDLIETFELHQRLLRVASEGSKRRSSKFLSLLKEQNNRTFDSWEESLTEYKKWMKMKARCTQRNYFLSNSSIITDMINTFHCCSLEWKQTISKLCNTEFLILQLELIKILTEQLSNGVTFNLQNAPLLFLTCESLCTVLPPIENKLLK